MGDSRVDYALQHNSRDERPYLKVRIGEVELLDSGASRTIVGAEGWENIRGKGVRLGNSDVAELRMANGRRCAVKGQATLTIKLGGKKGPLQP